MPFEHIFGSPLMAHSIQLFFFLRNFLFAKKQTTTYIIYNTTYYYTTDIRITLLRAILTFLTLQYIHRIRYNTYATYDTRNYIIY